MPPYRLTMMQLLLLTTFFGLALGLYTVTVRHGHFRSIQSITFSPEGNYLVASYATGGMRIWNMRSRVPLAVESSFANDNGTFQLKSLHFLSETELAVMRLTPNAKSPVELFVWDIQTNQSVTTLSLAELPSHWTLNRSERLLVTKETATNHVQLWNIDSGHKVADINLSQVAVGDLSNAYDYDLKVVEDLLVVRYWDTSEGATKFLLYNVKTGLPAMPALTIVSGQVPFDISIDGKRLACVTPNKDLEIWDLENGEREAVFDVSASTHINRVALSSNGDVVICSFDGKHSVWSLSENKILTELEASKKFSPGFKESTGAIISPNDQWIAATQDDTVILWDFKTYRPLYRLPIDRRSLAFLLFSAAWIVWGISWGKLSRRERRRYPQRGDATARYSGRSKSLRVMYSSHLHFSHNTMISAVVLAIVVYSLFSPVWTVWGLISWPFFFIMISVTAFVFWIVIILLLLLLHKIQKGLWGANTILLHKATRAARCLPRTTTFKNVTLCYYGQSNVEAIAEKAYEVASGRFAQLVGGKFELRHPLLVLCFETPDMFARYCGENTPWCVYYGEVLGRRQIVICESHCLRFLQEPAKIFQAMLGDYFYQVLKEQFVSKSECDLDKGRWRRRFRISKIEFAPAWIRSGLEGYLALDHDGQQRQRIHRRLRSSAWYVDRNAKGPWQIPERQVLEKSLQSYDFAAFQQSLEFQAQCVSLTVFLTSTDDYRAKYANFILGLDKKQPVEETFEQHFGFGFVELKLRWRRWIAEQLVRHHSFPPRTIQKHLVEQIVPTIRFGQSMPLEQKHAIWSMASGGYLLGTEELIQIVADDRNPLREDAIWALQVISGHSFGPDTQRWRSWWNMIRMSREETAMADNLAYEVIDSIHQDAESNIVVAKLADSTDTSAKVVVRHEVLEKITSRARREPPSAVMDRSNSVQLETLAPEADVVDNLFEDVPPTRLQRSWTMLMVAGIIAICWSTAVSVFSGQHVFLLATSYYGIAVGTLGLSKGIARDLRGMSTAAKLLIVCINNCNIVSCMIGLVVAVELHSPHSRRYLESHSR